MNEEELSAWVDGEYDPSKLDEILDKFAKDPQLRQRYSRLRMARDSRRGVRVTHPDFTFADRVMIAIERTEAAATVAAGEPSFSLDGVAVAGSSLH